ncbi:hypothetical protein IWW55_007398, partial [Coemansia sp. RSA 2706]
AGGRSVLLVVRVLSAQDAAGRDEPVRPHRAHVQSGAAVHRRDVAVGRQVVGSDAGAVLELADGVRSGGQHAHDVHKHQLWADQGRAGEGQGAGRAEHSGAARRSAGRHGGVRPQRGRVQVRDGPGAVHPADVRRLLLRVGGRVPRGLSGARGRGPRHCVPEGEAGRGRRHGDHAAVLRRGQLPGVGGQVPGGGHHDADPAGHHADPELRRVQAHDGAVPHPGAAGDLGPAGADQGRRPGDQGLRHRGGGGNDRADARGGGARVPLLHDQPGAVDTAGAGAAGAGAGGQRGAAAAVEPVAEREARGRERAADILAQPRAQLHQAHGAVGRVPERALGR